MTNKEGITKYAYSAYKKLRSKGYAKYNEEAHCIALLEVMMGDRPFITEFCKRNEVGISTVNRWRKKHEVFDRCFEYGLQVANANWMTEAQDNKDIEEFNWSYWKLKGSILFQLNQSRRIKVHTEDAETPMAQYKNIMKAASAGEYTATEIKQLMEAVNVGIRAYESDELSKRIDEIESDAKKMVEHNGTNITEIEQFKKAN